MVRTSMLVRRFLFFNGADRRLAKTAKFRAQHCSVDSPWSIRKNILKILCYKLGVKQIIQLERNKWCCPTRQYSGRAAVSGSILSVAGLLRSRKPAGGAFEILGEALPSFPPNGDALLWHWERNVPLPRRWQKRWTGPIAALWEIPNWLGMVGTETNK